MLKKILILLVLAACYALPANAQTRPSFVQLQHSPVIIPEACGLSYQASSASNNDTILAGLLAQYDTLRFVCSAPIPISNPVIISSGHNITGLKLAGSATQSYLMAADGYDDSAPALLSNVVLRDCVFDGSSSYPAINTDPDLVTTVTTGLYLRDNKSVIITNCVFKNLSGAGLFASTQFAASAGSNGLVVSGNTFNNGHHQTKAISIYGNLSTVNSKQISVFGNTIKDTYMTYIHDASDRSYTSSKDAIHLDQVHDSNVFGNIIEGAPGIGIRIEESRRCSVFGNIVSETGEDGIVVYNNNEHIHVHDNIVTNFGRLPFVAAAREFGGKYYYSTVFPSSSVFPLPADPSSGTWYIAEWPFAVSNVATSTIPTYDNGAYYVASDPATLLPFRGFAGIVLTQNTNYSSAKNNRIVGNVTKTGALYNYASNYGVSISHPVNSMPGVGVSREISGNNIRTVKSGGVHLPEWIDGSISTSRASVVGPVINFNNYYDSVPIGPSNTSQTFLYVHETDPSFPFSNITSAIEYALTLPHLRTNYTAVRSPIVVYVCSPITEQVDLRGVTQSMAHIEINASTTIDVTMAASDSFLLYPQNIPGPSLALVFDMQGTGGNGVEVSNGGSILARGSAGIINAGGIGCLMSGGARGYLLNANFTGAAVHGVAVNSGSIAQFANGLGTINIASNTIDTAGIIFQ